MAKQSAGILLYRTKNSIVEVLLVHPGGPFWAKKDQGAWSIPKGEFTDSEEPLVAAKREFREELGQPAPKGTYIELGQAKQSGGKVVFAWAYESDLNISSIHSNTFTMEWPPRSGKQQEFPEVDKAAWVSLDQAAQKLVKGQVPLLETLADKLGKAVAPKTPPIQESLF
jgi:predicted NUDIX family NTP pyrophosphohydrolase